MYNRVHKYIIMSIVNRIAILKNNNPTLIKLLSITN